MPFSIWEYIRERARDAVLAGIQDALDVAEQGDADGSQHQAARQLGSRLGGSLATKAPEHNGTPLFIASTNGEAVAVEAAGGTATEAPKRPTEPTAFDDDLQKRLDAAAPQAAAEPLPPGRVTTRRKRGRPPKNKAPQAEGG